MYPQGVCRIRKPAYAGNGCAIFLVFRTEEVGQKDGCGLQTQLRACCLCNVHLKIGRPFPLSFSPVRPIIFQLFRLGLESCATIYGNVLYGGRRR